MHDVTSRLLQFQYSVSAFGGSCFSSAHTLPDDSVHYISLRVRSKKLSLAYTAICDICLGMRAVLVLSVTKLGIRGAGSCSLLVTRAHIDARQR